MSDHGCSAVRNLPAMVAGTMRSQHACIALCPRLQAPCMNVRCRFVELKWEHLEPVVHRHVALRGNASEYRTAYMNSQMNYLVSELLR